MNTKIKLILFFIEGILSRLHTSAQVVSPIQLMDKVSEIKDSSNRLANYNNKKLPVGYESETITALSYYSELRNVRVKFRIKRSFATLKTKPTFLSMFMPEGHRSYVITISDKTIRKLMPLTFANLPVNARIGVIGHELAHVVDFSKKTTWQSFKVALGHLNKHYMDSLEFNTDRICIDHGLGKNLETWSSYIRSTMHTAFWRGADCVNKVNTHFERYMNPGTIEKYINKDQAMINTH
jgi:hypothetical protein